ncbi:MAG: hypothetical protein FJX77_17100, partial [Armatimonadetes bacterium]|nr:hypothetical protein [Armatimonadota bacterium]
MKLAEMTWPEMAQVDRANTVLLAPYAACEQHGPHLPFFVDTFLCTAVAEGVEKTLPDRVVLLPTQWLGASAHHLPFFGTLTADLDQHIQLMVHPLAQYLKGGWKKIFILNGHGGNIDTYHIALRALHEEFPAAGPAGPTLLRGPIGVARGQRSRPRSAPGAVRLSVRHGVEL